MYAYSNDTCVVLHLVCSGDTGIVEMFSSRKSSIVCLSFICYNGLYMKFF